MDSRSVSGDEDSLPEILKPIDSEDEFCVVNSGSDRDIGDHDEDDDVSDARLKNWEKRKMLQIYGAIRENDIDQLNRLSKYLPL
jgi:hypothetical protein